MSKLIITIPCYNEQDRLQTQGIAELLSDAQISLLFVNDGSTDRTAQVLDELRQQDVERIDILSLPTNRGKAEAVRAGMKQCIAMGASITGYVDADLSTPPDEVLRLVNSFEPDIAAVLGARIARLGADIQRTPTRHYLGRVFATAASLILNVPVYDTQCGAKFFRSSEALETALATPFRSRWAFDVELLGRLLQQDPKHRIVEIPLQRWTDVAGSELRVSGMAEAAWDLMCIANDLRKDR